MSAPQGYSALAPSAFHPSWRRGLFAAVLAAAAFFLPQEAPLQWYPQHHPGNELLYLEFSCASDRDGEVQIFFNATRGINQQHSFRFPIAPTEQPVTYSFPLLDAPITELRLDPPSNGTTLRLGRMRIVDARSREIRRFTIKDFIPAHQIESVSPSVDGWEIKSSSGSNDPYLHVALSVPIVPEHLNARNFRRCALSTGYLGLMLWLPLLAVLFASSSFRRGRELIPPILFMGLLAALFAPVGNRGFIRDAIHFASFRPPSGTPRELRLEIDLVSSGESPTQLYWDVGRGINGADSERHNLESHRGLQTVSFSLPREEIRQLRYDPRDNEGSVIIRGIRVVNVAGSTNAILQADAFDTIRDIAHCRLDTQDRLHVQTIPAARDPILLFRAGPLETINRAIRDASGR